MKVPVVSTAGVKPDKVANVNNLASNLSPQEVETEGSGVQGHLRLRGEDEASAAPIIQESYVTRDGH